MKAVALCRTPLQNRQIGRMSPESELCAWWKHAIEAEWLIRVICSAAAVDSLVRSAQFVSMVWDQKSWFTEAERDNGVEWNYISNRTSVFLFMLPGGEKAQTASNPLCWLLSHHISRREQRRWVQSRIEQHVHNLGCGWSKKSNPILWWICPLNPSGYYLIYVCECECECVCSSLHQQIPIEAPH